MIRRPRWLAVVSGAALSLLVMGCNHPVPEQNGRPQTNAPMTSDAATPSQSQSQSEVATGIVVMGCRQGAVEVDAMGYDPSTHQQTFQRRFPLPRPYCPYFRQQFDPTFTKLAVALSDTAIGYVEANSGVHQLTSARGSGFADKPPQQQYPVFNPVTGALWFHDGNTKSYATIDLQNPANIQQQPSTVWSETTPAEDFAFSADGKTVISPGQVTTFDGQKEARFESGGVSVYNRGATEGKPLKPSPGTEVSDCNLARFIDDNSFLCVGIGTGTSPLGLYKMTMNIPAGTVTQRALLPEASFQEVHSVVVDPTGQQAAFIAFDQSTGKASLYVVPLSGGDPTKIAELDAATFRIGLKMGDGLQLAAWRK